MEHRWGKRSTLDVAVRLHSSSGITFRGRIANLSLSGALVLTEVRLPVFSQLLVELDEDGDWGDPDRLLGEAYVARETRAGLGLEWTEFSSAAVAELLSLSAARLDSDVELHAEHNDHPRHLPGGGVLQWGPWR